MLIQGRFDCSSIFSLNHVLFQLPSALVNAMAPKAAPAAAASAVPEPQAKRQNVGPPPPMPTLPDEEASPITKASSAMKKLIPFVERLS